MTSGTPLQRKIALTAGLALLALMNYLDLVGTLPLGLSSGVVALAAAFWTGAIFGLAGPDLGELKGLLVVLAGPVAVWIAGVVALGAAYPDVGDYYAVHATVPGQVLYAIAPVLELALAVALVGVFLAWGLEYRQLKNTDPEERILQETDP